MDKFEEIMVQMIAEYGKPREGYEEFAKTCKLLDPMWVTTKPRLCKGYVIPGNVIIHQIMLQPYYDSRALKPRESDVLVASYPKTGTTWVQEICCTIANDGDLSKSNSVQLDQRSIFIENPPKGGIFQLDDFPRDTPRIIKTHMPYSFLPPDFLEAKSKIIYVARNPRDTCISYYYFSKMVSVLGYAGTLREFFDLFISENILYSSFADHVIGFWNRRHDNNVLFLTYEDLKKNLRGEIEKIAKFMSKELTDEQLDRITKHCTFESMSTNPKTNYSSGSIVTLPNTSAFMRKGQVGDWKVHFDEEMIKKMDEYVDIKFKSTGITFQYEI